MKADTIAAMDAQFAEFPFKKAEGVTLDEVDAASTLLDFVFPDDYKEFLLRFGGAIVGAYEVFGLRRAPRMGKTFSVIEVNQEFRQSEVPGTADWLIVSEDHAGNPIGIGPDGKIYTWDHDFRQTLKIAESFEDYLRKECLQLSD